MESKRSELGSSEKLEKSPAPILDEDRKRLCHDYFSSGDLSDFTIIASCGREFKTHRIILSVTSEYFDVLFTHKNTKEALENKVILEDFDATTIEKVIGWAYQSTADVLDLNVENITMNVVFFVDRYLFHTLKLEFCEVLPCGLTVDVVCERAFFASFLKNAAAFDAIVSYFAENKVEIMGTESYEIMYRNHPRLTVQLLEKCILKDHKLLKEDGERADYWQDRYMKSLQMASGQLFARQQTIAQNLPETEDQLHVRLHQVVIDDEEQALPNAEAQLPNDAERINPGQQHNHELHNGQAQPPNQVRVFVPNPQLDIRLRFVFHVQSAQNVLNEMTEVP